MKNRSDEGEKRLQLLNEKYKSLSPVDRIIQLYQDFQSDKIMVTSSFAATSAYFLHLFSLIAPGQKIFFIDTGYHFKKTLSYKNELTKLYNLNIVEVRAEAFKHEMTQENETYKTDPNLCCHINKVEPLEQIAKFYDVWVSGLMAWQTAYRATLNIFELRDSKIKFYPLIDVTREERDEYIQKHNLPFHPLVSRGYQSIGCTHCTVPGADRDGRWNNSPKTECGLHL